MQGGYKNQGLPRPYYMKAANTKKNSPYHKGPIVFFSTPRRKIFGYLILIMLFGTCMWMIGQDIKPAGEAIYEVEPFQSIVNDADKIVGSTRNADKEADNPELAGNMAHGSKGDIGVGIAEAPKGGMANEAPVVGNDKDKIVDGAKKNKVPPAIKADIRDLDN